MSIELTNDNHDSIINNNNVLIVFSAKWCGPCKRLKPELIYIDDTFDSKMLSFVTVDVDVSSDLAVKYNVSSLPTLVLVKDGTVVETHKGVIPRDKITQLINKHLLVDP